MAIVKSYIANTQKEAFDKVKLELGSDAVIINTRKIRRKGIFGFFKKPLIELTAVVDEHSGTGTHDIQKNKDDIQKLIKDTLKEEKLERIEKQMSEVSETVSKVYEDIDLIKRKDLAKYEPETQELFEELKKSEISEDNAIKVIKEAKSISKKEKIDIKKAISKVLYNYIGEPSPINLTEGKKNIVFLVGPTGVGKTTTLAKIAAIYTLQYEAKVSIITEDTYRIGAVEQLKIYADILGLPLHVIYTPEEIKQKVDSMENVDLILVDTAGKNTMDKEYHETIKKMIDICEADEVHLVISATSSYNAALRILDSYSFLEEYKVLFTKLDECPKWGIILDMKMITKKPLSYVTHGQNVAEDILLADSDYIVNRLMGSEVG